jgi:hypothetical protein
MDRRPPFVNDNYDFTLEAYIMNAEGSRLGGNVVWKNTTLNERIQFLKMLTAHSDLNNPPISNFLRLVDARIEHDILSIMKGSPVRTFTDQLQFNMFALCYMFPNELDNIQSKWAKLPTDGRKSFLRNLLTNQNTIYGDAVQFILDNMRNNGSAASSHMENATMENADNVSNAPASGKKEYDPTASSYPSVNPKHRKNNVRGNSSQSATASSRAANAEQARAEAEARANARRRANARAREQREQQEQEQREQQAREQREQQARARANANARARARAQRAPPQAPPRAQPQAPPPQQQETEVQTMEREYAQSRAFPKEMLEFFKRWHPWEGWDAAFAGGYNPIRKAIAFQVHPDKVFQRNPELATEAGKVKYNTLFRLGTDYVEFIKPNKGGTRRRSRHTKNKSGSKRRTHHKKRGSRRNHY